MRPERIWDHICDASTNREAPLASHPKTLYPLKYENIRVVQLFAIILVNKVENGITDQRSQSLQYKY